jgi:hypothetical protein
VLSLNNGAYRRERFLNPNRATVVDRLNVYFVCGGLCGVAALLAWAWSRLRRLLLDIRLLSVENGRLRRQLYDIRLAVGHSREGGKDPMNSNDAALRADIQHLANHGIHALTRREQHGASSDQMTLNTGDHNVHDAL